MFYELIAAHYGDPETSPFGLTPRVAFSMSINAGLLEQELRGLDYEGDEFTELAWLPPIAQRLATPEWYARWVDCFKALADRILNPPRPGLLPIEGGPLLATNVGEEVALVHILRWTADNRDWSDIQELLDNEGLEQLPEFVERDYDWEFYNDALFPDRDFEVLWDDAMDGVESSNDPVYAHMGYANLHPSKWFNPFPGST